MSIKRFILIILFSNLMFSCADYNAKNNITKNYYSSKGFALIYDKNLYINKTISKKLDQEKVVAGRSVSEILKRFDKKIKDPRSFADGKKIVKIITSFLKINCKLSKLDKKLLNFAKKNNLKKNTFRDFKSILNLKKLNQNVNFIANFGREVEYYTGIVFEVFSGKKEIARGGRYDDLLKSLGAKKNIPAVGAAINLKNI